MLRLLIVMCALFSIPALAVGADLYDVLGEGFSVARRSPLERQRARQIFVHKDNVKNALLFGTMSGFSSKNKSIVLDIMLNNIADWKILLLHFYSKDGYMLGFTEENKIKIMESLNGAYVGPTEKYRTNGELVQALSFFGKDGKFLHWTEEDKVHVIEGMRLRLSHHEDSRDASTLSIPEEDTGLSDHSHSTSPTSPTSPMEDLD